MIRFLCSFFIFLVGCSPTVTHTRNNVISTIDIDEVEENIPAGEFARLCLSQNSAMDQLVQDAILDGWKISTRLDLERVGLADLHRSILEIPGGGGRYRETQTLLKFGSKQEKLIANLMERFDRNNQLVRTECSLYAIARPHLPVCAAVGKLLKRPPDSNQRFKNSNAHFIRWNVTVSNRLASVRCDGHELREDRSPDIESFSGTTISMIVDQTATPIKKRSNNTSSTRQYR